MLCHDWRSLGVSAEEVRQFCVWRDAPMRFLSSQGDVVDSYDPEETPHRVLPVLQRALLHVSVREARAGARTLYRGEAQQELPPIVEWKRFDPALPYGSRGEPQSDPQQSLPVQRAEAEVRHANP